MSEIYVQNKHLKDTLDYTKDYLDGNDDFPQGLFFELINELKVSNLIMSADECGEEMIFETVAGEDGSLFIPLFTDCDEYCLYHESEFSQVILDFAQYVDIVLENDLNGILIDPESRSFPLEREFLENIYFNVENNSAECEPFSAEELKEMLNFTNDSLRDLINSDEIITSDRLFAELSSSVLFNIVICENRSDDIVKADDAGEFVLCNVDFADIQFGAVFTDTDLLTETAKDLEVPYYVQITRLSEIFEFVLRNDMGGVIINPNSDDYIIHREDILPQASGIELIAEDPRFKNCSDYAFRL